MKLSINTVKRFCFRMALPVFILCINSNCFAQQPVITLNEDSVLLIGNQLQVLHDETGNLNAENVVNSDHFILSNSNVPGAYLTKGNFWIKFAIYNPGSEQNFIININYPLLNEAVFYRINGNKIITMQKEGFDLPFNVKKYKVQSLQFDLTIRPGDTATCLLKIKSEVPVILPVKVAVAEKILQETTTQDIFTSLYLGIILALFLYNVFIYLSVRDRSYIYYVIYIFFIALSQTTLQGYAWHYLWPAHPEFNRYAIIVFTAIAGTAAINFTRLFLNVKAILPKFYHGFSLFIAVYAIAVVLVIAGQYYWSFRIIDISAFILVLYSFIISIIVARKGNRSGIFFLISWTIFILAMFVFVLRNLGIYPYNTFSNYVLYLGSSMQVILLSIALADRINIYKKEKEKSQEAALRVSLENEKLVKEQNIVLEQKVAERTEELQNTNHQLNDALSNLKDAQMQLVEAEKMASLGQLTAGIAHEINNPINFVKSNVKPLRLDIDDLFEIIGRYNELHSPNHKDISQQLKEIDDAQKALDLNFVKDEIQQLIKGIEDGAERTAEIVQGLRTFSRLDEAELKTVNVHDGIESTLVILRNSMPYHITLKRDFRAEGNIDCYPGKLNQVFMNILNNALQAINAKQNKNDQEIIEITTLDTNDDKIEIHIKDTGIGMTEEIKHRIYEPFFTTKDVGEGTGLGMAIVFKIIELHSGKIDIVSSPGKGAEIILTLPHNQPIT